MDAVRGAWCVVRVGKVGSCRRDGPVMRSGWRARLWAQVATRARALDQRAGQGSQTRLDSHDPRDPGGRYCILFALGLAEGLGVHEDGEKIRPGSTPWRDGVSARARLCIGIVWGSCDIGCDSTRGEGRRRRQQPRLRSVRSTCCTRTIQCQRLCPSPGCARNATQGLRPENTEHHSSERTVPANATVADSPQSKQYIIG